MDNKAENTLINYQSTISRLKSMFGGSFTKELSSPNIVIKRLEQEYGNPGTRRTYFARIIKLIKENPSWKVPKSALDRYRKEFQKLETKRIEQEDTNEPNERERKNWISWGDFIKIREKTQENAKSFNTFQDYLIMCLYTMNPPVRLDYTPMKVITRLGKLDNDINYLLWSKTKKKFIFNVYKTARFHGSNEIDIPMNLRPIIEEWFKKYNPERKWLLINKNGDPMSQNFLSHKVRDIIMKYTKKNAGVSMMRHSFISSMMNNMTNLKTRKQIAKQMGQTVLEQLKYQKFI